jgi:hypothetical protein
LGTAVNVAEISLVASKTSAFVDAAIQTVKRKQNMAHEIILFELGI